MASVHHDGHAPEIKPFLFEGEALVRRVLIDGSPWFVAADVCRVLKIAKVDSAVRGLEDQEKGTHSVSTPGGVQALIVVSESGLYALVFRSRKPEAIRFRLWVTGEVLPALRKDGRYAHGEPLAREGEVIPPRPPAERRTFPDWPLDEMRVKKGTVDMYKLCYGILAAQWIAPQLGFPVPPPELIEHGRQLSLLLNQDATPE